MLSSTKKVSDQSEAQKNWIQETFLAKKSQKNKKWTNILPIDLIFLPAPLPFVAVYCSLKKTQDVLVGVTFFLILLSSVAHPHDNGLCFHQHMFFDLVFHHLLSFCLPFINYITVMVFTFFLPFVSGLRLRYGLPKGNPTYNIYIFGNGFYIFFVCPLLAAFVYVMDFQRATHTSLLFVPQNIICSVGLDVPVAIDHTTDHK